MKLRDDFGVFGWYTLRVYLLNISGVVLEIRFGFESFRGNFVFTMEE